MMGESGAFFASVQGIPPLSLKQCDGIVSQMFGSVFFFRAGCERD